MGVQASAEEAFGSADLTGKRVVLQGVGAVGGRLAILLKEKGALVTICDINKQRVAELAAEHGFDTVDDDKHLDVDCDIYAPCARGAGVNDETIPKLKCRVIAGCANNILEEERHGFDLKDRGILYAPDYVINAGGIINVSVEFIPGGYDEVEAMRRINRIGESLRQVYAIAREKSIPTAEAADLLAERRLEAGRKSVS